MYIMYNVEFLLFFAMWEKCQMNNIYFKINIKYKQIKN